MLKGALVDTALRRYGLPPWVKDYLMEYLKGGGMDGVKRARSFVQFGRKKGTVTKDEIVLPNGTKFKKIYVVRFLSLCYYGEERLSEMSAKWAKESRSHLSDHFTGISAVEARRARAIKNLISGLGHGVDDPSEELASVFDYVEGLRDDGERLLAKKIILNCAYAEPYGYLFFKVFYPVSPEFMRSFVKTFSTKEMEEVIRTREAEQMIREHKMDDERAMEITRELLARILKSINAEMGMAKKAGIGREAELLRDISIAYPLHRLRELGVDVDIKREISSIKRTAA